MEYFIVVDNAHAGPFTVEQLKEKNIDPDTYAWHKGLKEWTLARNIPELAAILWQPPAPEPVVVAPQPSSWSGTQSWQPATETMGTDEGVKAPSSYLAWSIVVTILFFLPLGVAAIVCSCMVRFKWRTGQVEKARRYSEAAAWLSNCAFVVGLILVPFQLLLMFL